MDDYRVIFLGCPQRIGLVPKGAFTKRFLDVSSASSLGLTRHYDDIINLPHPTSTKPPDAHG